MIFDYAGNEGMEMKFTEFIKKYEQMAKEVYKKSKLTKDIDNLIAKLKTLNFKIGLVTSTFSFSINYVLPKLKNPKDFAYMLSLTERNDIKPKPYPDGYLETIKMLGSNPKKTIILEDSNKGIKAAKASGAFTICLLENLPQNYRPKEADIYAETISDVIKYISSTKGTL